MAGSTVRRSRGTLPTRQAPSNSLRRNNPNNRASRCSYRRGREADYIPAGAVADPKLPRIVVLRRERRTNPDNYPDRRTALKADWRSKRTAWSIQPGWRERCFDPSVPDSRLPDPHRQYLRPGSALYCSLSSQPVSARKQLITQRLLSCSPSMAGNSCLRHDRECTWATTCRSDRAVSNCPIQSCRRDDEVSLAGVAKIAECFCPFWTGAPRIHDESTCPVEEADAGSEFRAVIAAK